MLKWILILIVLVIIGFISWRWYKNVYEPYNIWLVQKPIRMSEEHLKTYDPKIIKSTSEDGFGFSIIAWIKVDNFDFDFGKKKIIMFKNPTTNLYFSERDPTLVFSCRTLDDTLTILEMKNFPVQRWVHVAINVFQDSIDMWRDGKLIVSKKLSNVPDIQFNPLLLGNKHTSYYGTDPFFRGHLSKVKYMGYTLSKREIEKYADGNPLIFSYLDYIS